MDAQRIELEPDPFDSFFISQGFRIGDLILLSGQVGMDDSGNTVNGGFDLQADQAMSNIQRVLQAAGSDVDKIVKVTIYVTDMQYRENVIALRQRWFKAPYPADTFVAVAALGRPERLIEIDATALVEGNLLP
jgi:2-iminobutanoate/2-iminopropanoate deaminase